MSNLKRVGVIWKGVSKHNIEYLKITFDEGGKYYAFPNRRKISEYAPDYTIFVNEDEEMEKPLQEDEGEEIPF